MALPNTRQQQTQQCPPIPFFYAQMVQMQRQHNNQMATAPVHIPSIEQLHRSTALAQETGVHQGLAITDQQKPDKRTLSAAEIELFEGAEMDNDPNTRVVIGSASKRARKPPFEPRPYNG